MSALNGSEEEVKEFLVPILSELFDYLDQQLKDASMRRTFLLWRLKFLVASRGRYHWSSSQLLTEFKLREDICGLVQTSKIVFESRLDGLADLAVSALIEAVKLEKDEREREKLAAGALEMVSVLSENVTSITLQLASLITSFAWRDRALLGESIKISWNTWIKFTSRPDSRKVSRFWYSILASLHNTAVSQREDEIAWDSAEPTPGRVDLSHYIIPRYYFSFRTSPAGEENCEGSLRIVTREEDPDRAGYYSFKKDVSVMINSTPYYKVTSEVLKLVLLKYTYY